MTAAVKGFDLHCHVDLLPDPVAYIAECDRDRILTLAVTTTPRAWPQNRRWTERSGFVVPALGLHPELVGLRHSEVSLVEQFMEESPFVGEIGLDGSPFCRDTLPIQKEVFSRILVSAERLGARVLSIHSRRAGREVLAALIEHTTPERVLPILHWFSDRTAAAAEAADFGCYFSINRRMCDSETGRAVIRNAPADRLLTESDAPFLRAGSRNSKPADVTETIVRLAEVRNVPVEEMRRTVASNAERVFAFAGVGIPVSSLP